ncbi:hypothetical protein EH196_02950 [Bacillus sp. C1-1]|nr:hypothetical protein EH196_02950 [Bacillus sp. C1-1]
MEHSVVIPKINYPFSGDISKHAEEVQLSTHEWAASQKILDPITLEKYDEEKLGFLASRIHANGEKQDIELTSEFLLLFCILDDYSDQVKNENEFNLYLTEILSIFAKGYTNENDALLGAWVDWWRRVKGVTNVTWREKFIHDAMRCFDSLKWEVRYRIKNASPDLNEYMIERQHTGSVYLVFDLIEKSNQNYIPNEIKGELFFHLVESANKIVNWTNDLVSLNRELETGDVHNLVVCIQKQENLSLNEAISKVEKLHYQEVDNFMKVKEKLLNVPHPYQHELNEFILGLKQSIAGYYEWSVETNRY